MSIAELTAAYEGACNATDAAREALTTAERQGTRKERLDRQEELADARLAEEDAYAALGRARDRERELGTETRGAAQ